MKLISLLIQILDAIKYLFSEIKKYVIAKKKAEFNKIVEDGNAEDVVKKFNDELND